MSTIEAFISGMPKAELHVHIESSIPPEIILEFAEKNGVSIPYKTVKEVVAAQDYGEPGLEKYLDYHYVCLSVLRTGDDIKKLTRHFLKKCQEQNTRHVEISFDPQIHVENGLAFDVLIEALVEAQDEAERLYGLSSDLIMCMQRYRPLESGLEMLELAAPHRHRIKGVGLDSYETGNPPIKWLEFYTRAREQGYRLTAHCDCDIENSVTHIWQCVEEIGVERIDHGLNVIDDPELHAEVKRRRIPITMCPTYRPSDPGPRRVAGIRRMLELGLEVSINSDAPEQFVSGYLNKTLIDFQKAGDISREEIVRLIQNVFNAAWLSEARKLELLSELDEYVTSFDDKHT